MENLGIASVAAITVITYLMGMAVRASRMDNKWIPILCGLLGGLLGLVSFYLLPIPDYPAGDPITSWRRHSSCASGWSLLRPS